MTGGREGGRVLPAPLLRKTCQSGSEVSVGVSLIHLDSSAAAIQLGLAWKKTGRKMPFPSAPHCRLSYSCCIEAPVDAMLMLVRL